MSRTVWSGYLKFTPLLLENVVATLTETESISIKSRDQTGEMRGIYSPSYDVRPILPENLNKNQYLKLFLLSHTIKQCMI